MAVPSFIESPAAQVLCVGQIRNFRREGNAIRFSMMDGEDIVDSYASLTAAQAAFENYKALLEVSSVTPGGTPTLTSISPNTTTSDGYLLLPVFLIEGVNIPPGAVATFGGPAINATFQVGTTVIWTQWTGGGMDPGTYDVSLLASLGGPTLYTLAGAFTVT